MAGASCRCSAWWQWVVLVVTLLVAFAASPRLAGADDPAHLISPGLPGQPQVSFKQYAGHVPVGGGKHIFYWFVTAQGGDPTKRPVAFWFNGGPGCSSLGNGGLSELGPFYVNSNGTGLVVNEHAWNRDANIVFVESPVGVGYSYSLNTTDYEQFTDDQTAEDAHAFLVKWLSKFPEYASNDIYLTGESYAGHYVPQLAQKVVHHNEKGVLPHINFKGFMVGNAWTDTYSDNKGAADFYYTHALISRKTYLALINNCDFAHDLPVDVSLVNQTCTDAAVQAFNVEMGNIDIYNVYGSYCTKRTNQSKSSFLRTTMFLEDPYPDPCHDPVTPYLNLPEVINAFHATNSTNLPWQGCSSELVIPKYSKADKTTSVLPIYRELLTKGLRIWVYSGDIDGIVPTLSTRYWLQVLDLPIETPWYAWNQSTQVGGWTEKYQNLTFATVRHAGHLVPLTQPARALTLFQHFLQGELLPAF